MRFSAIFVALAAGIVAALGGDGIALADAPVVSDYHVEAPDKLTVGGRVKVTILVEADTGTRVEIAPGGIPQELELAESARFSSRGKGSGKVELRIDLVLAPFVLGEYAMPPIMLRYRDATGASGEIQTPASRLLIQSTLSGPSPQPRDLKPQADIGAPPPPLYEFIALAGGAFVLAMGLMYVAWRRVQRPAPAVAAVEPERELLGPEDAARRALDSAGVRFATEGDARPYYAVISSTVRGYLTQRFGFPAFALTTVELQAQMVFRGMDRWQARLAGGLLQQCDAVMFADYLPAAERADADLTAAFEVIEMSRPADEPQEVAGL